MHIPDGYLGPQTYIPAYAAMTAIWSVAVRKLKKSLRLKQAPVLALGAAFCFVIMMFNVPIPGGTTGHAVGSVLVAVLLGPWAAVVAISLALIVQALMFGDGGITAIGANCLNMAVIMPFTGYAAYRLIAGKAPAQSARHWIGGAVGGYLGLCVAAVVTGVEFGIQPLLAHDAAGRALYCPFGLNIAVPMMAGEHLLLFGFVEAVATGMVIAYLQRTAPHMLHAAQSTANARPPARLYTRLAVGLGALVVLCPLGIYLPSRLHAGTAWGEWSSKEIKSEIAKAQGGQGYVPAGIAHAEDHGYSAPLPDYNLRGNEQGSLGKVSLAYLLSGAVGVGLLGAGIVLARRMVARKDDEDAPPLVDA